MAKPVKDSRTGTFRYRPVLNGKQIFCQLDTTKAREAEALAYSIDRAIFDFQRGLRKPPEGVDTLEWIRSGGTLIAPHAVPHTLGELIDSYKLSVPRGAKAESTLSTERTHFKNLLAHFGEKHLLTGLNPHAIEGYVEARKERDSETLKKELATLGMVWRYGKRIGWVTGEVPTQGVRLPRKREKERFRTFAEITELVKTAPENEHDDLWESCFLSASEIKELLAHVKTIKKPIYAAAMVAAAAFTGARRSELMRSRKRDWDLVGKSLTIREKKRVHSASESFRYVELHPELIGLIRPILDNHEGELVFSNKPNVELLPRESAKLWYRIVKGTKWEPIRGWHVLRHSFASHLAVSGVGADVIDKMTGHQTKTMRERYRHLLPQDRQSVVTALSSFAG